MKRPVFKPYTDLDAFLDVAFWAGSVVLALIFIGWIF